MYGAGLYMHCKQHCKQHESTTENNVYKLCEVLSANGEWRKDVNISQYYGLLTVALFAFVFWV